MDLKKLTNQQLLELLDGHDCHLSPNDSCQCQKVIEELDSRVKNRVRELIH